MGELPGGLIEIMKSNSYSLEGVANIIRVSTLIFSLINKFVARIEIYPP